jgi:putative ABC transport system permease protein
MSPSLFRLGQRYLLRRPLQSLLVILGIALGVAVVIAIDLANGSASRAFTLSTETIAGKATHQVIGGPSGVPVEVYTRLRRELGLRNVAPTVSGYVIVPALGERPLRLLGIDPFTDAPFRSYLSGDSERPLGVEQLTGFLTQPNTLLVSEAVATTYGVTAGETITLAIGAETQTVVVAGLLAPSDDLSRRALDSLLIADIATAQELLGQPTTLSTIDLILPEGAEGETQIEAIENILPTGVRVERPAARTATVEQLSRAFELNLSALSLLALVVGMFLIYNTVMFSVVQRRPVLGTLRALGVTQREIFALIMSEAFLLGVIGALLGVALGILLGRGAVRLITQTINDLYFTVNVEGVTIVPENIIKGLLLGVGSALLAAFAPAWEAATVPPVTALRRSSLESKVSAILPYLAAASLALGGVGLLFLWVSTRSIFLSFAGLFAIVIAFALFTPLITIGVMRLLQPLLARFGLLGRIAPRDITRALSRTSVAIAALTVAVSVIVGVSVMIGSFRQTVVQWLDASLQADIYISPPSVAANRTDAPLDPAVAEEIENFPGVGRIATIRDVDVYSPELGTVQLVAVTEDDNGRARPFKWVAGGDVEAAWARVVNEGAIFVTEPFAFRHDIQEGDSVTLLTDQGEKSFPVLAVYYDYSSDRGSILLDDAQYRAVYEDPYISSVVAYAAPGVDVDALVTDLRALFAGEQTLLIRSNVGLRAGVLEVFERAFAITGALQLLATIVAFIGVLAALMALQLERARDLGTLRAIGMTQGQLWRLTMLETGLMGGTAGLWAMPCGLALSLILIYVINVRSFGWTLQLQLAGWDFGQAFAVALVAALLAGLYPAYRMSRIQMARAIRSE